MIARFAEQPPAVGGQRYADIEIGAAVQNLALSCTARGLEGPIVGGLSGHVVVDTLGLTTHEPRLLFGFGHPA